jgi:hypothetical protein
MIRTTIEMFAAIKNQASSISQTVQKHLIIMMTYEVVLIKKKKKPRSSQQRTTSNSPPGHRYE